MKTSPAVLLTFLLSLSAAHASTVPVSLVSGPAAITTPYSGTDGEENIVHGANSFVSPNSSTWQFKLGGLASNIDVQFDFARLLQFGDGIGTVTLSALDSIFGVEQTADSWHVTNSKTILFNSSNSPLSDLSLSGIFAKDSLFEVIVSGNLKKYNTVQNLTASYSFDLTASNNLDNGNLSQVPVPAATWLFGSAIAGLAALRRRITLEA